MVFADNVLRIEHKQYRCGMEFNALDALKLVDTNKDCLKVAVADAWREARLLDSWQCFIFYLKGYINNHT